MKHPSKPGTKSLAWATLASLSFAPLAWAQTEETTPSTDSAQAPAEELAAPVPPAAPTPPAAPVPPPPPAPPAQAAGKKTEVIQVTGSRIKQIDLEAAGSMTTFGREAIEESGYGNVADFLRNSLPSATLSTENATLSQVSGSASFAGRDFAASYTLVLLNGRRLPNNAIADDFVDLNLIPTAAVERVEYLTDGASAIYGSDAVAGVLNIITRKNFEGTSFSTRLGRSSRGDGTEVSYQVVSGAASDRANFMIAGDSFKREAIETGNRPLAKSGIAPDGTDGRSGIGLPGFYTRANGEAVVFSDCPEDRKTSTGRCSFDFAPYFQVAPKSERQSIYTVFDYQLTPEINFFGEARYSRTYTQVINSSAPGDIKLAANAPNNPVPGEEITVYRRYLDFGRRAQDSTNESFSTVGGLKGPIGDSHNWSFEITRHILRNLQVGVDGNINKVDAAKAFNDGTFNPFIYNTVETQAQFDAYNAMKTTTFREGISNLQTYSLAFDGSLPFELAGGSVGYATGVEFRDEKFVDRADNLTKADLILGSASSDGSGSRQNEAVYGELALPVLKSLDLSLAARHDRIDNKHEKTTYKFAVLSSPIDMLKFRASVGTGFKSPNMHELYLGRSFGVQDAVDPASCGDNEPCEINSEQGGNPDLEPEESLSYNFGVVAQVTPEISLRADYWDVKIENKVDSLDIQAILNDPGQFGDLINRDPNNRLNTEGSFVRTNLQNLTEENSAGVELGANYANNTSIGRISSALLLNKLVKSKSQDTAADPLCDYAKRAKGVDGSLTFDWNQGTYGAGGTIRHNSAQDTYSGGFEAGTCTPANPDSKFTVDAHNELDLRFSYTAPWATEFGVGILNVTDEAPEFDRNYSWPWYDQEVYSNIGRQYYLTATHAFQ